VASPNATSNPATTRVLAILLIAVPLLYHRAFRDFAMVPKLIALEVGVAAIWLLMLASPSRSLRVSRLHLPVACFLAWSALSLLWATDPLPALLALTKWTIAGLLFWAVSQHSDSRTGEAAARALSAVGIPIALMGLAQHAGFQPLAAPSSGLPSATLGFRNIAAMFLIQSIPFAAALLFSGRTRRDRILAGVSLALMLGFLAHTRTRGAWLGLLVAVAVGSWLVTRSRETKWRVGLRTASVPILLALVLLLLPGGLGKVGPQSVDEKKDTVGQAIASVWERGGDRGRLDIWRRSLLLVPNRPLHGVGLANWSVHYPRVDGGAHIGFASAPERPHSELVAVLCELGLVGLSLLVWIVVATARSCVGSGPLVPWQAASAVSLVAIAVHACFSFPSERITPLLLIALSLGFLAAGDPFASFRPARSLRAVGLAAIAILAVASGVTLRIARFESAVARATAAERAGRLDRAAIECAAAAQAGAFHPELHHLRGYALNQLGRYAESVATYVDAVERRPFDVQLRNGYGLALRGQGRLDQAEAQFRAALDILPSSIDVHYNLAGLYMAQRRPERAVTAYEEVLSREQPSADLWFRLGNARALAGQDGPAVADLERALQLQPGLAQAQFVLGEVHFRNSRWARAKAAYEAFLSASPEGNPYANSVRKRLAAIRTNTKSGATPESP